MTTDPSTPITLEQEPSCRQALAKVAPEMDALPANKVMKLNVLVVSACATVMGVLPKVRALRPTIAQLPDFDLERFDKLEDYAEALLAAEADWTIFTKPDDKLQAIVKEGEELRDRLHKDAEALVTREIIPAGALRNCRGRSGYKHLANELMTLAGVFDPHWDEIQGHGFVTRAETCRACDIGVLLLEVVGTREQRAKFVEAALDRRNRAFTLLWHSYDDARRAVHYLRWKQGDADEIAPSLHPRASKKKKPEGAGGAGVTGP